MMRGASTDGGADGPVLSGGGRGRPESVSVVEGPVRSGGAMVRDSLEPTGKTGALETPVACRGSGLGELGRGGTDTFPRRGGAALSDTTGGLLGFGRLGGPATGAAEGLGGGRLGAALAAKGTMGGGSLGAFGAGGMLAISPIGSASPVVVDCTSGLGCTSGFGRGRGVGLKEGIRGGGMPPVGGASLFAMSLEPSASMEAITSAGDGTLEGPRRDPEVPRAAAGGGGKGAEARLLGAAAALFGLLRGGAGGLTLGAERGARGTGRFGSSGCPGMTRGS